MSRMKYLLLATLSVITVLLFPALARADIVDTSNCPAGSSICQDINATPGASNSELFGPNGPVTKVTSFLAVVMGVVAIIVMIFAGYTYITSGGDTKKVGSAKTTIIYAAIGIVIALSAQAIVSFILVNIK